MPATSALTTLRFSTISDKIRRSRRTVGGVASSREMKARCGRPTAHDLPLIWPGWSSLTLYLSLLEINSIHLAWNTLISCICLYSFNIIRIATSHRLLFLLTIIHMNVILLNKSRTYRSRPFFASIIWTYCLPIWCKNSHWHYSKLDSLSYIYRSRNFEPISCQIYCSQFEYH